MTKIGSLIAVVTLIALAAASSSEESGDSADGTESPSPPSASLYLLREDVATKRNPYGLWRQIAAQDESRHELFTSGGPNGSYFRRMSVRDGDDYSGERAELGYNTWKKNGDGSLRTFFNYGEGERRVTEFWIRLAPDFPLSTSAFQVVMQMKQAGPSSGSGGSPVLALEARQGEWQLQSYGTSNSPVWSAPARRDTWTRFSFDVTYSVDPAKGRVRVDTQELGGALVVGSDLTMQTLKPEEPPGDQGIPTGQAIPSHLRIGIYHDPLLPGTHVDIADVRVLG